MHPPQSTKPQASAWYYHHLETEGTGPAGQVQSSGQGAGTTAEGGVCVSVARLLLEDNFQSTVKRCFSFPAKLEWGCASGDAHLAGWVQVRPNSPQSSYNTAFSSSSPPSRIHEESCRRAWERMGSPLPLQGPVQPFPARVGGLGFRAASSHAGLFGGLGRARIHDEAPGPRASPRQHSSQQLLILSAAQFLGPDQGLAGT